MLEAGSSSQPSLNIQAELKRPKISVLMSVYRGVDVLAATVKSVLDQTISDLEFVIVVDGPDHEVEAILEGISDSRIVVLVLPVNVGVTKALNQGLDLCQGEYVARMDNGDFCETDRLQVQLDSLVDNGATVSFCQTKLVDEEGTIIETTTNKPWILRLWMSQFCQSLGTSGPALLVEAALLKSVGGYDESYRYAQDYEICERLAALGKEFVYTEKVGVVCPSYADGISRQKRSVQEELTRKIMARATRRILPEVTDEQLRSFPVWRRRFLLEGENDPLPAIKAMPDLATAFARFHDLKSLPFEVCNDIAEVTETHFLDLSQGRQWIAFRVMLWCAWQCKSFRLFKFAGGAIKRWIQSAR